MGKVSLNNNLNDIVSNLTDDLVNDLTESNPTVTTDKDDYAPGETAQITGSGFTPGSEVVIQIVDDPAAPGDDGDADVYQPITIIADEFGSFSSTWFVPIDNNGTGSGIPDALNATLFLTARGTGADGVLGTGDDRVAMTTFTDGGRPGSNNTGSSSEPSQNAGEPDIVTKVSITLVDGIEDTDPSGTVGYFPDAVASYTKTVSQGGEILSVEFDYADLDLRAEVEVSSDDFAVINYKFVGKENFDLVFTSSPPDALTLNNLTNNLSFIKNNLFAQYSSNLQPFPGFPFVGQDGFEGVENTNSNEVLILSVTEDIALTDSGKLPINNSTVSEIAGETNPNNSISGTFGSLSWDESGDVTYMLNNNAPQIQSLDDGDALTERFPYKLDNGDTADLIVTINGVTDNNPPNASDDNFSSDENTLLSDNVLTTDSDPNAGDILTVTEINDNAGNVGTQITLTSGALLTLNSNGTFSYDPNGQFEDLNDGETATDTFRYTISDGSLTNTATVTIEITGVNDAPVLNTLIPEQTANPFNNYSFALDFRDPDGDSLTLNATLADGSSLPGWLSIDNTGTLTGFPTETDVDTISILVTANDGNGGIVSNTFDLTVEFPNTPTPSETFRGNNRGNSIIGTLDNDKILGRGGRDKLYGIAGDDIIFGGKGADVIEGGAGRDFLIGGDDADLLLGGIGSDVISGGNGLDVLEGGAGADQLFGGNRSDILRGGWGPDLLSGGNGQDVLRGGAGADQFLLIPGSDGDIITDFQDNIDTLVLPMGIESSTLFITNHYGDALISLGDELLATVKNSAYLIDMKDFGNI